MSDLVFPHPYVIGSDEVGFGCWAGPLYVCATLVPKTWDGKTTSGVKVRDSKQMTAADREEAYRFAMASKVLHWVEIVQPQSIDDNGARRSLINAHVKVISKAQEILTKLGRKATIVADGNLPLADVVSIPKADDLVPAVSLASCIAKVLRDRAMVEAAKQYPTYGFDRNMGYGVADHQKALEEFGPCPIHRMSYGPVKRAAALRSAPQNAWEIDDD